jgi:hypothetical protein
VAITVRYSRPELVEPEPYAFDQLQSAVAERRDASDPQLVRVEAM